MPGAGVPKVSASQVQLRVGQGRHGRRLDLVDEPIEPGQKAGRAHIGSCDRSHGAAQLTHGARRTQAAADDVADHNGQDAVVGEEDVVPVTTDLEHLDTGPVDGRTANRVSSGGAVASSDVCSSCATLTLCS